MPLSYKIHSERKLVLTVVEGNVTADEVRLHFQKLADDPLFNAKFFQLIDSTRLLSSGASTLDVCEFARYRIFAEHTRHALVAKNEMNTQLAITMAVQDQTGAYPSRLQLFTDFHMAIRWLGQQEDVLSLLSKGGACVDYAAPSPTR